MVLDPSIIIAKDCSILSCRLPKMETALEFFFHALIFHMGQEPKGGLKKFDSCF